MYWNGWNVITILHLHLVASDSIFYYSIPCSSEQEHRLWKLLPGLVGLCWRPPRWAVLQERRHHLHPQQGKSGAMAWKLPDSPQLSRPTWSRTEIIFKCLLPCPVRRQQENINLQKNIVEKICCDIWITRILCKRIVSASRVLGSGVSECGSWKHPLSVLGDGISPVTTETILVLLALSRAVWQPVAFCHFSLCLPTVCVHH